MRILLETYGTVILFLAVGMIFFYIFARILGGVGTREDRYQDLESLYSTRQLQRRDERMRILKHIGKPECPDGTFSDRQNYLWSKYHELEAIDKTLTAQERNDLVNAKGYISDEYMDIIEGKR
jgi:hypothetical protein